MTRRLLRLPAYVSLSRFRMRAGSEAIHWRMKFEPMKPAPPVTRIRSSMPDAQKGRVPILIIITAGREVMRSFGRAYTDQTGAFGWGWGPRARSSGAAGTAEVRNWICVLG